MNNTERAFDLYKILRLEGKPHFDSLIYVVDRYGLDQATFEVFVLERWDSYTDKER